MEITYSKNFLKSVKLTPKPIQRKLANLLEILRENPFHPSLHTKPLVGKLKGFYSFRTTRDWRVIFIFLNSNKIFLIDIAHRKDIYRWLSSKHLQNFYWGCIFELVRTHFNMFSFKNVFKKSNLNFQRERES